MFNSHKWRPVSTQVGYDMTRLAAKKCFEAAGLKPSDIDVIELHDCFSANELITYEALGLCPEGEAFCTPFSSVLGIMEFMLISISFFYLS